MEERETWPATKKGQKVVITDIDIPFGSMVNFMVKGAIAVIPAVIILAILGGIITVIFAAIFGSVS
jgi:hypothetical protein